MKNVTIKDIAKVAGVSYATVSRALSGSHEVGSDTRERILQISKEMGYTTNVIARAMVMRRSKTLGLILTTIDNPFMSEIAYYIEQHARAHDYNIMLCHSAHDHQIEHSMFELLMGRQVDGIIIIPCGADSYEHLKGMTSKVPTVFLSENLRDVNESYVSVDNTRGAYMAIQHLYSLGHRDILYFGRRKGSTTHQLRADGYMQACEALGLTPQILYSDYPSSSIEYGYNLAKQLFSAPFTHTAIFASADSMALGVMQAADEFGVRIPEDVSLIGFDNIRYAELPRINLTTIEQPKQLMASVAVDMLFEKISSSVAGYNHRILTPTLVERKSCKKI